MSEVQKIIGESAINSNSSKKLKLHIADGAVTESKIADEAVTPEKISPRYKEEIINPLLEQLQHEIDSIGKHGIAVSTEFGDDPYISVSQKTLTDAINNIWEKLNELTGEPSKGFRMEVSRSYFVGDECEITMQASTSENDEVFEEIAFYTRVNTVDTLIVSEGGVAAKAKNVTSYSFPPEGDSYKINDTTEIVCKAKILGETSEATKTIRHYYSFWLGAGDTYDDIMVEENMHPKDGETFDPDMKGSYLVNVPQGKYIFIMLGNDLAGNFRRADLNGFEIPFTSTIVTVSGESYKVFRSDNQYVAGNYTINING